MKDWNSELEFIIPVLLMADLVADPPKLILCPVKDNVPALSIVTAGVFAVAKIRIGQPVTAVNG